MNKYRVYDSIKDMKKESKRKIQEHRIRVNHYKQIEKIDYKSNSEKWEIAFYLVTIALACLLVIYVESF